MPAKMSAEDIEKKREQILDAAFAICMKKPMHEISMRDIITEVGFSQGNIYRYFASLDEIIIELINRKRIAFDVKTAVDDAVSLGCTPERVISELFKIWGEVVLGDALSVSKIYHEMSAIYASDHERRHRFVSRIQFITDNDYLRGKGFGFAAQKVKEGYFKPMLLIEDIVDYVNISFSGIIRETILTIHYRTPTPKPLDKDRLLNSLCTAFVLLLGGNEKLIYPQEAM